MIENLGGVTSEVAWLALDALSLRHQVISHNIANAETPGFVPKRLEFSEHLHMLVNSLGNGAASLAGTPGFSHEIDRMREELRAGAYTNSHTDQEVEIDMEMVDLTANVLQYRSIIEAQTKRGEILRMAIRERSM